MREANRIDLECDAPRSTADFLRGSDGSSGPSVIYEIEVMACNWRSVEVYQQCALAYVGTGMQAICTGFEAKEIVAVMDALNVRVKRRPRILRDVIFMGRVAAGYINEQNARAAAARKNG